MEDNNKRGFVTLSPNPTTEPDSKKQILSKSPQTGNDEKDDPKVPHPQNLGSNGGTQGTKTCDITLSDSAPDWAFSLVDVLVSIFDKKLETRLNKFESGVNESINFVEE